MAATQKEGTALCTACHVHLVQPALPWAMRGCHGVTGRSDRAHALILIIIIGHCSALPDLLTSKFPLVSAATANPWARKSEIQRCTHAADACD